jgi:hypothetical protein
MEINSSSCDRPRGRGPSSGLLARRSGGPQARSAPCRLIDGDRVYKRAAIRASRPPSLGHYDGSGRASVFSARSPPGRRRRRHQSATQPDAGRETDRLACLSGPTAANSCATAIKSGARPARRVAYGDATTKVERAPDGPGRRPQRLAPDEDNSERSRPAGRTCLAGRPNQRCPTDGAGRVTDSSRTCSCRSRPPKVHIGYSKPPVKSSSLGASRGPRNRRQHGDSVLRAPRWGRF